MKRACKEGIYKKTQVIKECRLTGKHQQIKEGKGRYHYDLVDELPF